MPADPEDLIAKDYASAKPGSLVQIDRKGQVRSPGAMRARQYGAVLGMAGLSALLLGVTMGWVGAVVGGAIGLTPLIAIARARGLRRATLLIAQDRLDEAEALLRTMRPHTPPMRAMVEQRLATIASRRGRYEHALVHLRAALGHHAAWTPQMLLTSYAEVVTLVNLDRVREAREVWDRRRHPVPAGDYLRTNHWTAELYLVFAEGAHRLDDDELHARARVALGLTVGTPVLALLAWAFHQHADDDQAWHLLGEAIDRRAGVPLERAMPRLHAWIEANAAKATSPS